MGVRVPRADHQRAHRRHAAARARSASPRHPADILITTPESLYLLLTSQAAEALRTVDTVIVDEIHALVPTKRGAHLALTLERLEALVAKPLQRIGLSATQRPLEEVARFLGGVEIQGPEDQGTEGQRRQRVSEHGQNSADELEGARESTDERELTLSLCPSVPLFPSCRRQRSATAPSPSSTPARASSFSLRIEVPVEDMARLGEMEEIPSGPASQTPRRVSIWNAIHPRLLELIRERNSTILFVNSRQVAERLAGALNELAGEPIARAHHGSLAAAQRSVIEEQLKAGQIQRACARLQRWNWASTWARSIW